MLNSKWLKNLWTNFLEIYSSTIDFASIFLKVMQLSMFSFQILKKKNVYPKFWVFSEIPREISNFLTYLPYTNYVWVLEVEKSQKQ